MRPAAIQSATFAAALCSMIASTSAAADERVVFFEKRVRPTLTAHCYECHGASETMGGLRLDSRAGWQLGGERGPAIVPGKPDESLLIRAIRYADKKLRMPPPDAGGRLTDRQIADLESWIRAGAVDPRAGRPAAAHDFDAAGEHWAFQPIPNAEVPESQHPIDFFVNRNLQKRGFEPTPRASRHTLVRRAAFDLHGLPPTADQYNMSDFGRLVQSLLDSPRYGERWGRHWLDVARYADTKDGVLMYGNDRMRPFAYTYRDYVIRAFNQDKPFDRFVHEQLAADQLGLAPDAPELAALGLLTLGRMFDNNRHDVIDDQIDVVTRGFVGLTVSCARCHDHKFDPIPTADYYSLYGVFASCEQPLQRPRIERPTDKGQEFEKALAEKIEAARKYHDEQYRLIWDTARKRTPDYLVRVATTEPDINETAIFFLSLEPHQLRPQIVYRWRQVIQRRSNRNDPVFGPWFDLVSDPKARAKALADSWRQRNVDHRVIDALVNADPTTPETIARAYGELMVRLFESGDRSQPTKRDEVRDLLVGGSSPIWFLKSQTWHHMSRGEKDTYRGLVRQCDLVAVGQPHAAARAMAIFDADTLYDPVVFQRGDPAQPGQPVARQFLRVLSRGPRQAFPNGSGRLDLAKAITDGRNPLTARVLVNRIWMHHFGEPLVENPSDFGIRTPRPEYAELLDYLASQLIRGGWRLKPLHRLIMTSAVWQRDSIIPKAQRFASQQEKDPDNRLLWRGHRRRLGLESMRDSLLLAAGLLDTTMFGPAKPVDDPGNHRRTVYALVERQAIPAVVRNFDFASPDSTAARRISTTVPQQALFAMNSKFVTGVAKALAGRVSSGTVNDRIVGLHEIVFGRPPTDEEIQLGIALVNSDSLQHYCQVLLMTNEFMFVD